MVPDTYKAETASKRKQGEPDRSDRTLSNVDIGSSFAQREAFIAARSTGNGRSGVMKEMNTVTSESKSTRYRELKKMLEDRRRELQAEAQRKMRDVRSTGEITKLFEVFDAIESSE